MYIKNVCVLALTLIFFSTASWGMSQNLGKVEKAERSSKESSAEKMDKAEKAAGKAAEEGKGWEALKEENKWLKENNKPQN